MEEKLNELIKTVIAPVLKSHGFKKQNTISIKLIEILRFL